MLIMGLVPSGHALQDMSSNTHPMKVLSFLMNIEKTSSDLLILTSCNRGWRQGGLNEGHKENILKEKEKKMKSKRLLKGTVVCFTTQ